MLRAPTPRRRAGYHAWTPAPVVAEALGYHHHTTTRAAAEVAATWGRYATGPRPRKPAGWPPIRDS
ncbi:hypothetical protein [Nocardia asiatica]|uniref:hypothetical protein n=1 Tax=Nocardia asiatica TaxID=209252 RepID=UPI0002F99424|nr:hypothetical protein [Nocardia asiatica]